MLKASWELSKPRERTGISVGIHGDYVRTPCPCASVIQARCTNLGPFITHIIGLVEKCKSNQNIF